MVVFAGQAAVQRQRAVDLLDHPPFGLRDAAFALVGGVAADDLDGDVQQGAVDDGLVLETRGRLYGIWLDGTLVSGVSFPKFDAAAGTCEAGC